MKRENRSSSIRAALVLLLLSFFALTFARATATLKPQPQTTPPAATQTASTPQRDEKLWRRALEIHRKAIVVDGHNDITSPMIDEGYDLGTPSVGKYHTDIARMKQGGMTAQFFSIYVDQSYAKEGGSARRAMDMIDSVYRLAE